jgi:16S rRNA (uracil1498-N3)-methyltransferase
MGGDGFQMSRFFVSTDAVDSDNHRITITGEDVKHIRNVLRCIPGDALELSDGSGMDYDVAIESIEKDNIFTKIVNKGPNKTEPPVNITLFQGIPKADKMEYIIQKCIELGVVRIVPVMTARTVVRFESARDTASKTLRWKRIALEAAKQCDRGVVPLVEEPVRLEMALKLAESCDLRLLPYEEETDGSLRKHLQEYKESNPGKSCSFGNIALFIGPEGGFTTNEVQKAVESGFKSVTLGPRILRTETAGVAVISIMMYELGDMAGKSEKGTDAGL